VIDHTSPPDIRSEPTILRVTSNGSISLPALIRRRWGVDRVAIIDRGDFAIVRPVPADPVTYFYGRFAGRGPTTEEMRAMETAAEIESEEAKARRVSQ